MGRPALSVWDIWAGLETLDHISTPPLGRLGSARSVKDLLLAIASSCKGTLITILLASFSICNRKERSFMGDEADSYFLMRELCTSCFIHSNRFVTYCLSSTKSPHGSLRSKGGN